MDGENRPDNEKIKSTVISVVHAHAPDKSDYVWTRRRPLGPLMHSVVGRNKRRRDGPFFFSFALLLMDRVPKDRAVPQRSNCQLCKPKLRSQVSDPGVELLHPGIARIGGYCNW
jgi:hypothetical protein